MAIKNNPMQCKLTDFGESRLLIHQARPVLATRTKYIQQGTLLFWHQSSFLENVRLNKQKQEDLNGRKDI